MRAMQPGTFRFYGDPTSQAIAASVAKSQMQAQSQSRESESRENIARMQGQAGVLSGLFAQPSQFANTLGQAYGAQSQGYGSYANNITGLANAEVAHAGNRMAAYAAAEAARQQSLGRMGTAELAQQGNASLGPWNAWAANQTAMAKALSDMAAANQAAVSQYGVGRNSSLANLGSSAASLGAGMANARAALGNAYGNMGGAGASASAALGGALGQSLSSVGNTAMQSQAGLRGSAANALSSLGQSSNASYGALGSAASQSLGNMGAAASSALGDIGASAANAAGGLGSSQNAAIASLGGAAASAVGGLGQAASQGASNIGAAGQAALANIGQGASGMAGAFGNSATNIANSATQYRRDMAKLALARELGMGQLDVAGQSIGALAGLGGGGGGGGGVTISGPDGEIASGGYSSAPYFGAWPAAGSGGIAQQASPIARSSREWFQDPQAYDGGGMAALGGLADAGFRFLGDSRNAASGDARAGANAVLNASQLTSGRLIGMAADGTAAIGKATRANQAGVASNADRSSRRVLDGLGGSRADVVGSAGEFGRLVGSQSDSRSRDIRRQADAGAESVADAAGRTFGGIGDISRTSFGGINDAMSAGRGGLDAQSLGIDGLRQAAFPFLDGIRSDVTSSPVLQQLASGYNAGLSALAGMYGGSQFDPVAAAKDLRDTFQSSRSGQDVQKVVDATASGMSQFYDAMSGPWGNVPFNSYRQQLGSGYSEFGRRINDTSQQVLGLHDSWARMASPLLGGIAGAPQAYARPAVLLPRRGA